MTGIAKKGLVFQKFAVSRFEPFIEALFRNPVDSTDPDPAEFIPFQETVNGFAADAQNILQILNSVATVSGGRSGLNGQIVEIQIVSLLSLQGTQRNIPGDFFQVFFHFVVQDQFDIRGGIIVYQVIKFGSFVHVVSVGRFYLVTVDQDDIAGDEFRVNVTAVHIISGINNSNGAHHGFVLLSASVCEWGRTLKQHISTAGFVGCVPTDAPTSEKSG